MWWDDPLEWFHPFEMHRKHKLYLIDNFMMKMRCMFKHQIIEIFEEHQHPLKMYNACVLCIFALRMQISPDCQHCFFSFDDDYIISYKIKTISSNSFYINWLATNLIEELITAWESLIIWEEDNISKCIQVLLRKIRTWKMQQLLYVMDQSVHTEHNQMYMWHHTTCTYTARGLKQMD